MMFYRVTRYLRLKFWAVIHDTYDNCDCLENPRSINRKGKSYFQETHSRHVMIMYDGLLRSLCTSFPNMATRERVRRNQGCQMAITRFLHRMCLVLWASGLQLCYAAKFDPFLSLDCAPRPPPWCNPRKGRDQIMPSGNIGPHFPETRMKMQFSTLSPSLSLSAFLALSRDKVEGSFIPRNSL